MSKELAGFILSDCGGYYKKELTLNNRTATVAISVMEIEYNKGSLDLLINAREKLARATLTNGN